MSEFVEERSPSWRTTRGFGIHARLRAYRIGGGLYVKPGVTVKTVVGGNRTGGPEPPMGVLNVPAAPSHCPCGRAPWPP